MSEELPRFRSIEGHIVPSASRVRSFSCLDPTCHHAHLVGYDADNKPFCEIVVDEKTARAALIIATGGVPE